MKNSVITMLAALALSLSANAQEVMKVELKNGQVATYNVEDISRFYFEGAKQQDELATDCKISIVDEVVMTNAVAFELGYDSGIEKAYCGYMQASQAKTYSDEQLLALLINNGTVMTKDKTTIAYNIQQEGTDFVFLYIGFNSGGKHGSLYQHHFTTKVAANELTINISESQYDSQKFYYKVNLSNEAKGFIAIAEAGNDLEPISINPAAFGISWKQSIAKGEVSGQLHYSGDYEHLRPNGENSLLIISWVVDYNDNYSGIIMQNRLSTKSNNQQAAPLVIGAKAPPVMTYSKEEIKELIDIQQVSLMRE